MQRIVRLKDGSEYPCEMCGEYDGQLWIHTQMGIVEACGIFSDAARTGTITDTYAGDDSQYREIVWEGYTELFFLSHVRGVMQIGLRKENAA